MPADKDYLMCVILPVCLWAGPELLALLKVGALSTSKQRHHHLIHVAIKDVGLIGPMGQVIGYTGEKSLVRH